MTVGPEPDLPPPPPPGARVGPPTVDVCPLCGTPAFAQDTRCRECNMTLAGVGGRIAPFNRRSLWFWAAGLLAVYLVVLAVVAVAR